MIDLGYIFSLRLGKMSSLFLTRLVISFLLLSFPPSLSQWDPLSQSAGVRCCCHENITCLNSCFYKFLRFWCFMKKKKDLAKNKKAEIYPAANTICKLILNMVIKSF